MKVSLSHPTIEKDAKKYAVTLSGTKVKAVTGFKADDTDAKAGVLSFTLADTPKGTYDLNIACASTGRATGPGPAYATPRITLDGGVDSVTPGKGSVGGGRDVTIAGWGFSDKTIVTIGGRPCAQISSKYSEIKCVPPGSGSEKILSSNADIEIFVGAVGRPKLKLQAGSTLRASKVFLGSEEIIHTARTGLSVVVLDLDQYKPVQEVQTFQTGTSLTVIVPLTLPLPHLILTLALALTLALTLTRHVQARLRRPRLVLGSVEALVPRRHSELQRMVRGPHPEFGHAVDAMRSPH